MPTFRLSEQAQKGIQRGTAFEDLNMGCNRPTQIVRRYGDLYSEMRVETMDALDELPEMTDYDDLKGKLLFSVVVVSIVNAEGPRQIYASLDLNELTRRIGGCHFADDILKLIFLKDLGSTLKTVILL